MNEIFKNVDYTDIESVTDALDKFEFAPRLIAIIACIALAFFAYRFYRICITCATAYGFGALGYWFAEFVLVEKLSVSLPIDIALEPAVALVFALIGAIIAMCKYKAATFLVGAGVGYSLSTIAASYLGANGAGVAFFDGTAGKIIVGVVCALIAAFLLLFCFKFFYILITSVALMAAAGLIAGAIVYPEYALYTLIGGAVIGIIAMVYQYKKSAEEA